MISWVTLDCYGTLIDWERGITDALLPLLPPGEDRGGVAQRYIEIEAEVEKVDTVAHLSYREVLDRAGRRLLAEKGRALPEEAPSPLPSSLPSWPAFPEVPDALRALRERGYKIAILSNVDNDLLAASIANIGVEPDLTVTAQDARSYKPAPGHWRLFEERTAAGKKDTVHVAASLYHDIRAANALGYRCVWIARRTEPLDGADPTRTLPDLRALPAAIDELARS